MNMIQISSRLRTSFTILFECWLCFSLSCSFANDCLAEDKIDFNRDIRPILSDRCFHCHGPDSENRQAELRLDQPNGSEGAYRTLDESTGISPGHLESSEVWRRIISEDQYERMPPYDSNKKTLTAQERELLKKWILEGAKYENLWSFVSPQMPISPSVDRPDWQNGPIDSFVKARLEQEGLDPKPLADKRTLIRRVTFDLTGLPPTVEEIHKFLEDDSPEAYSRVVDRLLSSKAYGEHMARYWADLVRMADTNGMHKDFYRNFSTYRSWVIRAFNQNLPFDDFIKFQLAGDLYPKANEDQLVASASQPPPFDHRSRDRIAGREFT